MSHNILVVEDEQTARESMIEILTELGFAAFGVETIQEAKNALSQETADIVLLDVQLPDGYGTNLLRETVSMPQRPPIILITAFGDIEMAVDAMHNGAHDFIQKPVDTDRLIASINRAVDKVDLQRELAQLRRAQYEEFDFIIGETKAMKQAMFLAQRAAKASATVLITGETGTGKEVIAKAIHQMGDRTSKQMVGINCAAFQDTMIESELFGYEPGAFTSAEKRKLGLFEIANEGILFLDEISSMGAGMQSKLLRALEERSFMRLGGTKLIHTDIQIVAASNTNLPALIENGDFREDLFYRLNVIDIKLPALRERLEDLPKLAAFFIKDFALKNGKNITGINSNAMENLKAYSWPGNIRELRNVLERAVVLCDEIEIGPEHIIL